MKNMKKLITMLGAAALMLAAAWGLDAQTVSKSKDFSPFDRVEIWKNFQVTFENSTTYHADWEINEDLAPYVDIYVRQNTLIVDLDKEGAKYLKKNYRGGDKVPTMNITISLPNLAVLNMNEKSSISSESEPVYSHSFNLTAKDQAKIDNLNVNVEKGVAEINLSKNADVTMKLSAKNVKIATENSSAMALTCEASNVQVGLSGSSSVGLAGQMDTLAIIARNSSHLTAQGKGNRLTCNSKGVSLVEAERFEVQNASVVLNSAVAWVNVLNNIELDLSNSSELVFCGNPLLQVQGIKKSSVTRIENAVRRQTR